MVKIVSLDKAAVNPGDLAWDDFNKLGEFVMYDRSTQDEAIERAKDAEIVLNNKVKLDRRVLSQLKKVKYIGLFSTGYDVVDIEYCKEHDIKVCNVPAYSSRSVAQLTVAMLLEAAMGVGLHNESVKNKEWANAKDFCYWKQDIIELDGLSIGIVGYGSIGKYVANICNALGMKVYAYNRNHEIKEDYVTKVSLDELFKLSDVISLHCPLNKDSKELINKKNISLMKDNVIIINTARGGLINEEDLVEALDNNKVKAYCADVLKEEPPKLDNKLSLHPKTYITPHIAWASYSARSRLLKIAAQNIKNFLDGNTTNNVY